MTRASCGHVEMVEAWPVVQCDPAPSYLHIINIIVSYLQVDIFYMVSVHYLYSYLRSEHWWLV